MSRARKRSSGHAHCPYTAAEESRRPPEQGSSQVSAWTETASAPTSPLFSSIWSSEPRHPSQASQASKPPKAIFTSCHHWPPISSKRLVRFDARLSRLPQDMPLPRSWPEIWPVSSRQHSRASERPPIAASTLFPDTLMRLSIRGRATSSQCHARHARPVARFPIASVARLLLKLKKGTSKRPGLLSLDWQLSVGHARARARAPRLAWSAERRFTSR
ncbi:hypothetical protein VDGL01_03761 [Verticillium dahliae]